MSLRTCPEMMHAIAPILKHAKPAYLTISLRFYSPTNKDFSYVPHFVNNLMLVQNFEDYLADYMEIALDLPNAEYFNLINNYKDLRCQVYFTALSRIDDVKGNVLGSFNFRVVIPDMEKMEHREHLPTLHDPSSVHKDYTQSSTMRELTIQLWDPMIFNLRKQAFNIILRDVTVEQAIYIISKYLKIEKCCIRKSDNQRVYTNLVIPPLLTLTSIIDYLQKYPGYGIYEKGCTLYYSNGVLYVYPTYETIPPPTTQPSVNIYAVGDGDMAGERVYHFRDQQENYHIICNSINSAQYNTPSAIENDGSVVISLKSDLVLNKNLDLIGNRVRVSTPYSELLVLDTDGAMVNRSLVANYTENKFNPYFVKSKLSANKSTKVALTWNSAEFFSLIPGALVRFSYINRVSNRLVQETVPAVCSQVIYIARRETTTTQPIYATQAEIVLRVDDQTKPLQ